MKIRLSFKTPDVIDNWINLWLEDLQPEPSEIEDYDLDPEGWFDAKREEMRTFMGRWVKYGEVVTLEFDTESQTAIVVEAPR